MECGLWTGGRRKERSSREARSVPLTMTRLTELLRLVRRADDVRGRRGVGWAEGSGIGALAKAWVGGALEGAGAGPKAAAMGCWQRLGSEARWKGRGLGGMQRQKGRRLGRRQLSI